MKFLLFAVFAFCPTILFASSDIVGKWKTIDDKTKLPKSVVEIYLSSDGNYNGKIIKLFENPNLKCENCSGELKDQPLMGMNIISSLKQEGEEFSGGSILDPKNGKVYKCKMKKEGANLVVRGFIGISLLGRSQTWLPYTE